MIAYRQLFGRTYFKFINHNSFDKETSLSGDHNVKENSAEKWTSGTCKMPQM